MFKQLAIVAVAASAVSALDLSSLAGIVNPNLNSSCLSTLYGASQSVQGYCGVSNAIDLISDNATGIAPLSSAIYYVAENSTTLNTVCSAQCGSYLDQFAYTVLQSCGSTNLVKRSYNVPLTGSDLANAVRYVRRAICVPSNSSIVNSTYCIQDQLTAYKADFPNVTSTTYQAVLNDSNITGPPCAAYELAELKNNTSLSPYWRNLTESYIPSLEAAINATNPDASVAQKRDEQLYARSRFYRYT